MKAFHFFSIIFLCAISIGPSVAASVGDDICTVEMPEDFAFEDKAEDISQKTSSDSYLEAYIQGVLDTKYPDTGIKICVRNGDIFLRNLPADKLKADEVVLFVTSLTHRSVGETNQRTHSIIPAAEKSPESKKEWHGVWLPQSTILYPTQIANPRQISFSSGFRFQDKIGGKVATEITFGDQFPLYRWANFKGGDLQLEAEGGVFGVFDVYKKDFPFDNADYYGGFPLTYARGPWSYRLRLYHVSSHVGDEFLQHHAHFGRKNKSFEALDLSTDYQITKNLRLYAVLGGVVHSDNEMSMKFGYIEYGFEARGPRTDFKQLFGQPFLAVHMQNWQENHYAEDITYALGYEWGKIYGIGRKVRAFLEYHNGFSPDGQFSRVRTKYISLRLSYGF